MKSLSSIDSDTPHGNQSPGAFLEAEVDGGRLEQHRPDRLLHVVDLFIDQYLAAVELFNRQVNPRGFEDVPKVSAIFDREIRLSLVTAVLWDQEQQFETSRLNYSNLGCICFFKVAESVFRPLWAYCFQKHVVKRCESPHPGTEQCAYQAGDRCRFRYQHGRARKSTRICRNNTSISEWRSVLDALQCVQNRRTQLISETQLFLFGAEALSRTISLKEPMRHRVPHGGGI
ncbi:MAG: hypothetical protein QNK37_21400 [Acidobacteriota bacterium]|nr:hypothetical protein [Acidobacteriota bacterium]